MSNLSRLAHWGGPAAALVAGYLALWGVPNVAVAALLVGGGLVLSWGVPKLLKMLM